MIHFDNDESIVHIQTHTSHVFLRKDDVIKIKKPVDFSFLDYSTLEKRKTCCEKEVSLNRRFSPEVYLGVLPLYRRPDGDLAFEGEGEPVEYAVRMRRLPAESMLTRRLAAGDVRDEEMTALTDLLGAFYAKAESTEEIRVYGSVDQVRENTEENFETTLDFEEDLLPELTRQILSAANRNFLAQNEDLFAERAAAGRVLDGHGDLKPENLFLTPDGPVVTDCIEFNERFRYGDVLADIGYLTMGLMDAGRGDLRKVILDRYREKYEPGFPEALLEYYETYRAVVKGKIEGYRARQPEVPASEREEAREIALRHFRLAQGIVLSHRPVLACLTVPDPELEDLLVNGFDAGSELSELSRGRSVVLTKEPDSAALLAAEEAGAISVVVDPSDKGGSNGGAGADLVLSLGGATGEENLRQSLARALGWALAGA
jgi:aminoglycoside phosphotransferase family enzyme